MLKSSEINIYPTLMTLKEPMKNKNFFAKHLQLLLEIDFEPGPPQAPVGILHIV